MFKALPIQPNKATPIHAKYVFLDVVNFTKERSVESQTEVVSALNEIVKSAVAEQQIPEGNIIYLPTGDGICIAMVELESVITDSPYDAHVRLALSIVKGVHEHNGEVESEEHRFEVRIGVNERIDNLVIDINGQPNMAGSGINDAQRIMSLAEGSQIFLGDSVYQTLQPRHKFMGPGKFHAYKVTVKHDQQMVVHQYVEPGHVGLNTDAPETLKKEEAVDLFKSATVCGLKKIYYSREEVTGSVLRDVENAQRKVWVLGVGLSEKVTLTDLLPKLEAKIDAVDVKILLLDALRSPAVFRTFLEVKADAFYNIISANREKPLPLEPYCEQQLYRTFYLRYSELKEKQKFRRAVRFYGHTPTCWLIIVDNTAYFQPYTFGQGRAADNGEGNGWSRMPVFKFQIQDGTNTQAFDILEDHFNKLWLTSNTDLFHIGGRIVDKRLILRDIFRKRNEWFKHVYGALHGSRGSDRRDNPRKPCGSNPPPATTIEWEENGTAQRAEAKILNFSRVDALLELAPGRAPLLGTVVTMRINPVGSDGKATEHFKREFLEPCNGKFRLTRVHAEQPSLVVALQAYKE